MIVALSISPSGPLRPGSDLRGVDGTEGDLGVDGAGVADAVAAAVTALRASGLPCETNAMFTNIEGEWVEVMAAVKSAVDVVAAHYPRVGLVLKADIRSGYTGEMTAKLDRLDEAVARRH